MNGVWHLGYLYSVEIRIRSELNIPLSAQQQQEPQRAMKQMSCTTLCFEHIHSIVLRGAGLQMDEITMKATGENKKKEEANRGENLSKRTNNFFHGLTFVFLLAAKSKFD